MWHGVEYYKINKSQTEHFTPFKSMLEITTKIT